jgi:hypothetical protein
MKKTIFFLTTILCLSGFVAVPIQAQLLKKLKDKVTKAVEPKKDGKNTEPSNESNNEPSGNIEKSTKKQVKPDSLACKVIGQLGDGETFLYDETSVIAQNNALSYSFVITNKQYQYFLIENGTRTGPFKEAPIKSAKRVDEEEDGGSSGKDDDNITIGNDKKDPVTLQYSKTIGGKLHIVFNGKNYGPYDYVAKMIVSPDKKHFFAVVTIGGESPMTAKMGMGNTFMVSDAGLKKQTGAGTTMPMKLLVSNGFKHCMGTVMDSKSQKIITTSSTGKQEEGNMADMYSSNNISLVDDNGDIITIPAQSPTQILLNGTEVASFKVPIKNRNNLFLMPDVSKSVYYQKGRIYRPDGTEEKLTGIVFPKALTINKITSLYYYKLYKNEAGITDIYLCKKVL